MNARFRPFPAFDTSDLDRLVEHDTPSDSDRLRDAIERHLANRERLNAWKPTNSRVDELTFGLLERDFSDSSAQLTRLVEDLLPRGVSFDTFREAISS